MPDVPRAVAPERATASLFSFLSALLIEKAPRMNRTDRLTGILLLLQGGKRTAGELAARYEVSRRTILRDIDALGELGIPVIAEAGAGGGYSLPADYSLPPLALTFHEATLLRLALGGLAGLGASPYEGERASLLVKLGTLIPNRARDDLDDLGATVALDVPGRPEPTPFLDLLLECARDGRWVAATYRSEGGESRQTLLPARLRATAGLWYCEAFSHERDEMRTYRVDRFRKAHATVPPRDATPDLGLPHLDPAAPPVRVALTARGARQLEHEQYLAAHVRRAPDGDALLDLALRPADYDWLVRILLGLGTEARVVAPDALRERVLAAARALAAHHAATVT